MQIVPRLSLSVFYAFFFFLVGKKLWQNLHNKHWNCCSCEAFEGRVGPKIFVPSMATHAECRDRFQRQKSGRIFDYGRLTAWLPICHVPSFSSGLSKCMERLSGVATDNKWLAEGRSKFIIIYNKQQRWQGRHKKYTYTHPHTHTWIWEQQQEWREYNQ